MASWLIVLYAVRMAAEIATPESQAVNQVAPEVGLLERVVTPRRKVESLTWRRFWSCFQVQRGYSESPARAESSVNARFAR